MKKVFLIITLFTALLAVTSCSHKAHFEGRITPYSGATVETMDAITMSGETTELKVNKDGTFSWDFDVEEPHIYYIFFSNPKSAFILYAEAGMRGTINIGFESKQINGVTRVALDYDGDNKDVIDLLQTVHYYDAQTITLQHAKGNDWTFEQYRNELMKNTDSVEALYSGVVSEKFKALIHSTYEQRRQESLFWYADISSVKDSAFFDFVNSVDRNGNENLALLFAMTYYEYMLEPSTRNMVIFQQLPDLYNSKAMLSSVSDMLIRQILQQLPTDIEDVYAAYLKLNEDREIPEDIVQMYHMSLSIGIGKAARDFDMYDINGKRVTLSDLRGKLLYIDVWATWCGPCLAEIPHLQKLYDHYRTAADVAIISVSIDEDEAKWQAKVKADNPRWAQYIVRDPQNSALVQLYQISSIPRFLLIDKDGMLQSFDAPRPSDAKIIDFIESHR